MMVHLSWIKPAKLASFLLPFTGPLLLVVEADGDEVIGENGKFIPGYLPQKVFHFLGPGLPIQLGAVVIIGVPAFMGV